MGVVINPDAYYDIAETRKLLRLSVRALNKACESGGLRHRVITSGRKLFKGEWLIAWINAQPGQAECMEAVAS